MHPPPPISTGMSPSAAPGLRGVDPLYHTATGPVSGSVAGSMSYLAADPRDSPDYAYTLLRW